MSSRCSESQSGDARTRNKCLLLMVEQQKLCRRRSHRFSYPFDKHLVLGFLFFVFFCLLAIASTSHSSLAFGWRAFSIARKLYHRRWTKWLGWIGSHGTRKLFSFKFAANICYHFPSSRNFTLDMMNFRATSNSLPTQFSNGFLSSFSGARFFE